MNLITSQSGTIEVFILTSALVQLPVISLVNLRLVSPDAFQCESIEYGHKAKTQNENGEVKQYSYIHCVLQYNWGCPDKEVTVRKPFHHNYKLVAMSASNNCVCVTDIPNKVADRIP